MFRFKIEPPSDKQNDSEFLKTWMRSVKTPIQLRVLNVLRNWVEKHFRDFSQDPQLLEKLRTFLREDITVESMQKIASQILKQTEIVRELQQIFHFYFYLYIRLFLCSFLENEFFFLIRIIWS
jgi:hypothetical protein